MKLTDALATLDILEESLNMLARMQEMEVDALAAALARKGSADAVGDALRRGVNLGNITQNGQVLSGQAAIQAIDFALERAGAGPSIRRTTRVILSDYWSTPRVGDAPPAAASSRGGSGTLQTPEPERVYGTKPAEASKLAQRAINQISPAERDRLARQFAAQR